MYVLFFNEKNVHVKPFFGQHLITSYIKTIKLLIKATTAGNMN